MNPLFSGKYEAIGFMDENFLDECASTPCYIQPGCTLVAVERSSFAHD